jgi:hypothetical protein
VYLREGAPLPTGYRTGWNVRYTTELTEPVWFYVRGEEYSAQLDHFVRAMHDRSLRVENDFASAAQTDHVIARMIEDAEAIGAATPPASRPAPPSRRAGGRGWFASLFGQATGR